MSGLAQMYDLRDEEQAKEYLEKVGIEYRFQCFGEKRPDGCHRLADYFESFKKDYEKARQVYKTACDDYSYGHSCFKYGNYNFLGKAGKVDKTEAFDYYKKGCSYGYGPSCYNAALFTSTDEYNAKDMSASNEYLESGCKLNDSQSCYLLSTNFIQGKGVDKNMSRAFEFAKKACDMGYTPGCANVSIMYRKGEGVEKNLEKAQEFKRRALELHQDMTQRRETITFSE